MMNNYWINRITQNEAKADAIASTYSKRYRKLLEEAYKKIEIQLQYVLAEYHYNLGTELTRTQLWNTAKALKLEEIIRTELQDVGIAQIEDIKLATSNIFKETLDTNLSELLGKTARFNLNNKSILNQNLISNWSGLNYSNRIWKNSNELALTLKEHITNLITLGTSPEKIKSSLMEDFNVAYDVADRLVRTECSYAFNQANMASYKNSGLEKVKYIPERDSRLCDKCKKNADTNGGIYLINEAPFLPVHPRCRCTYAPVIN